MNIKLRLIHMFIVILYVVFSILVWWGIGYGVAWILEAGLNIDVNKNVFTKAGLIIGLFQATLIAIAGAIQNYLMNKD